MTRYAQSIQPSSNLAQASERFIVDLKAWIDDCRQRYGSLPATDVHDQGTYTVGWQPYLHVEHDVQCFTFLHELRDAVRDHFVADKRWRHGYWTMHEAHHGTEHFELYLGMLLRLDPGDGDTIAQLVDAAEHMGNWVDDVPPWFDWQSGLFRSSFFGADGVRLDPGMELNIPDHLRCVNISLLAHRATAQSRYLELATLYAGRWADAILADERLPIGLTVAGPIYDFNAENEAVYRSYMGEASALALPVDRAESFLTSDAINTFLYLGNQSGEERFVLAVRRLLDALSTQLTDPDAGAAADAIRTYRCRTMDSRYDEKVLSATAGYAVDSVCEIGFESDQKLGYRPSGVGKRSDMPVWLEDGVPRRHNPITLAVAAELNRDETQAIQAVDLARAYFLLARQAFPDGRDHGCAARTVSAIARGHGRENNAGVTTAVLMPMLAWT